MKKRAFEKLYKELFDIPKHEKLTEKVFRCRMAVLLLTILACTTVMVASTFALFFMDVSTENSTIASAYYSVSIENAENGEYICPLTYDDKHIFEIKADGTATTGYCKIQVGDQVYYTEQIFRGSSLTLTVQAAQGTVITFEPQWGISSNYINEGTCGNEIIHSTTPSVTSISNVDQNSSDYAVSYVTYVVESTVTLADIASYYNVSEEDILLYNNISEIATGMELKIPGVPCDMVPYVAVVSEETVTTDNKQMNEMSGESKGSDFLTDTVSSNDATPGSGITSTEGEVWSEDAYLSES